MAAGDSPERSAWTEFDGFPMAWSLGALGDLVWLILPQCRTAIKSLAVERLELDTPYDRGLQPIEGFELITRAVNPSALSAFGSGTDEDIDQVLEFVWKALTFSGPDSAVVSFYVREFMLDSAEFEPYRSEIKRRDPALDVLICAPDSGDLDVRSGSD